MELFAKRTTLVPSLTATFAFANWTEWQRWHFHRNIHGKMWNHLQNWRTATIIYLKSFCSFCFYIHKKQSVFNFMWNFCPFTARLIEILMSSKMCVLKRTLFKSKSRILVEACQCEWFEKYFKHIFITDNCLSNDISSWCQRKSS